MIGLRRIALLLLCVGISTAWSGEIRTGPPEGIKTVDFGQIYYGARCALHGGDPYDPSAVLRQFKMDGGRFPEGGNAGILVPFVISVGVNLPTSLFFAVPLALLPWGIAQTICILLIVLLLTLAAFLVWDLSDEVPLLAGCMTAFILLNCETITLVGNIAGISVGLCIIAVWCFIRNRYIWAGILLLALSLVLKPQDAGFVWLFFLLSRGVMRKRALQTLAIVTVFALLTTIWIAQVSPHWVHELQHNLALAAAPGSTNDPTPAGLSSKSAAPIMDLEGPVSIFSSNPHVYIRAAALIGGIPILFWMIAVIRGRTSRQRIYLGLAAISALTLLPVYHRTHDAKLLLLAVPACALLWAEKGQRRWIALALTAAGILSTSDIPRAFLILLHQNLSVSTTTLAGKMITLFVYQLAPLLLLAMGCFFLWLFVRYAPPPESVTTQNSAKNMAISEAD